MSDQKDDLDQASIEQGNEDPATRSEEQIKSASVEDLEQPKEEEEDLEITKSLDSKWVILYLMTKNEYDYMWLQMYQM